MSASAAPPWRVIGRSVAGSAHVARNLPCQDALAWRELPDGRLILAVADGAGSAARSELGAAAAVEAMVEALARTLDGPISDGAEALGPDVAGPAGDASSSHAADGGRSLASDRSGAAAASDWRAAVIPFDAEEPDLSEPGTPTPRSGTDALGAAQPLGTSQPAPSSASAGQAALASPSAARDSAPDPLRAVLHSSVAAARAGLQALAEAQGRPLRDYACTLTAVLALSDRLWVAQIGDSVAVARDAAGNWQTVGRPQKGEYANEAWFLTADGAMDQLEIHAFDLEAQQVILSSDGLLRLMLQLPGFAPHAPFLEPLARALTSAADPERAGQQLAAFLASDRLRARTDDDISLLWAARGSDLGPNSPRAGSPPVPGNTDTDPAPSPTLVR